MDIRYKIMISLMVLLSLFAAGLYTASYIKDYNSLSEEAALYGISPAGLSKKELLEEIENKKNAIREDNELKKLQIKAAEYGLSYEGLYIEELENLILEYEMNRVSIRGKIFSIVVSADGKTRTWTVIGEKTPYMDYSEAEVIVNSETKIYKGEELVSFDKVVESTEVEIMFSGFVDKNAVPVLAFGGKIDIIE
jgi:hypothetical protein